MKIPEVFKIQNRRKKDMNILDDMGVIKLSGNLHSGVNQFFNTAWKNS